MKVVESNDLSDNIGCRLTFFKAFSFGKNEHRSSTKWSEIEIGRLCSTINTHSLISMDLASSSVVGRLKRLMIVELLAVLDIFYEKCWLSVALNQFLNMSRTYYRSCKMVVAFYLH